MSYYSSAVTINAEGDTSISEETLEGLGMERPSRFSSLSVLFGAIFKIAAAPSKPTRQDSLPQQSVPDAAQPVEAVAATMVSIFHEAKPAQQIVDKLLSNAEFEDAPGVAPIKKKLLLTDLLPDPGYFAAGAIAGVISRTSTAPLDRLKVYLIANIGPAKNSLDAVKKGDAAGVAKTVGRPLIDASKELWKAGGIRSLFAGKLNATRAGQSFNS